MPPSTLLNLLTLNGEVGGKGLLIYLIQYHDIMITSNKTYIPGLKVAPEMAFCSGLGPGHGDGGPLIWREETGPEHNGKGSGPSTTGREKFLYPACLG